MTTKTLGTLTQAVLAFAMHTTVDSCAVFAAYRASIVATANALPTLAAAIASTCHTHARVSFAVHASIVALTSARALLAVTMVTTIYSSAVFIAQCAPIISIAVAISLITCPMVAEDPGTQIWLWLWLWLWLWSVIIC